MHDLASGQWGRHINDSGRRGDHVLAPRISTLLGEQMILLRFPWQRRRNIDDPVVYRRGMAMRAAIERHEAAGEPLYAQAVRNADVDGLLKESGR